MNNAVAQIVVVLTAIVGLAALAVLVSNRAQTASVITAFGNAFSGILGAAVSPVTGGGGFSASAPSILSPTSFTTFR